MIFRHLRQRITGMRKGARKMLPLLAALLVTAAAARADALTMTRMENSDFTVYFAKNPEGEKEKTEVLHLLGSQTAYCMNSGKTFQRGEAAAIDMSVAGWDGSHAEKAALAWYYVREVSSVSLTERQKEQIIQTMIWNIFKDKVTEHVWTLSPPRETFESISEAYETWYAANRSRYSYTASFYANAEDLTGSQAVAVFSVKENTGKMHVKKSSSDPGISGGNAGYSLEGAAYQVYTDSACTQKAATVSGGGTALTTDASGKTASVELAPGTYYVKETKAPAGFALSAAVTSVTVTADADREAAVTDAPVFDGGGLVIRKTDAETGQSAPAAGYDLAGAEYTVRFYAGIYTKDNLPSKPARTWVIRSVKTTSGGKTVYEASLSDACKVSGDAFYTSGGKVILPLGTVTVQETKAPNGYFLSEQWKDASGNAVSGLYLRNVRASSGGASLDGGSLITSIEQPVPSIATELADAAGSHYLSAVDKAAVLTDTVQISHFNQYVGKAVIFTGVLKDEAGAVVAQGKTTVTVSSQMTAVQVPITIDLTKYEGQTLLCDERAEDASGKLIASHAGAQDEKQKVFVPVIRTSLKDAGTGTENVSFARPDGGEDEDADAASGETDPAPEGDGPSEDPGEGEPSGENPDGESAATSGTRRVTLTDTVTYRNLMPGSERVMRAALHDAETGEAVTDAEGLAVTAEQAFQVSATGSGTVEVTFTFEMAAETEGRAAVAFESAEDEAGRVYAVHADLTDEAQTVYVSKIRTTVRDTATGREIALAGEDTRIIDRVHFENLDPDGSYVLAARAVLKSTGEEVSAPAPAETSFRLEGGSVAEVKHSADEEEGEGAEGADGGDGESDGDTGDGEGEDPGGAGEESDAREAGWYCEQQENGRVSGYIDVKIPRFDAADLAGDSLIFFETLFYVKEDGTREAATEHADPEDEAQTLHFPDGRTCLLDDQTGAHLSLFEERMRWTDRYEYRNLLPGEEYELRARVRCKETGELLAVCAEEDSREAAEEVRLLFVPEEPDGEVTVPFFLEGTAVLGRGWVAEETLLYRGCVIHRHEDPDDEEQSVYVPEIRTKASDRATGTHEGALSTEMVVTDEILCRGLADGLYEVSGTLMVIGENGTVTPLRNTLGEEITVSESFSYDRAAGEGTEKTVTVLFPSFDAERFDGKTVVVYERLYALTGDGEEKILVAVHEEPEEEEQYVRIPRKAVPEPTAPPSPSGTPSPSSAVIDAETVTPVPVRRQGTVRTGDESGAEKYLVLGLSALGAALLLLLLVKLRIYLFKKR